MEDGGSYLTDFHVNQVGSGDASIPANFHIHTTLYELQTLVWMLTQ